MVPARWMERGGCGFCSGFSESDASMLSHALLMYNNGVYID